MHKRRSLAALAASASLMTAAKAAEPPSVVIVHGTAVTTLPTSHVPQQSRPADVAEVILAAVNAVAK